MSARYSSRDVVSSIERLVVGSTLTSFLVFWVENINGGGHFKMSASVNGKAPTSVNELTEAGKATASIVLH